MAWTEQVYVALGAAIISSVSLAVSYITYKQKSKETERGLKGDITDAVKKLDDVFGEWDKLIYEQKGKPPDQYYLGRRSFLNGQKRFLAMQGLYLINNAPHLTSDFEYNRVADAFSSIGDFDKANELYLKAIEKADGETYRAVCTRAYARSLFGQGEFDEGRKNYQRAIDTITSDTNPCLYSKAETYQRWAIVEADNHFFDNAKEKIVKSREIYSKITSPRNRQQGLENINELEKALFSTADKLSAANMVLPQAGMTENYSNEE